METHERLSQFFQKHQRLGRMIGVILCILLGMVLLVFLPIVLAVIILTIIGFIIYQRYRV